MGKLVVTEFITLDGVMEDPGGAEKDTFERGGWVFSFDRGPDGDKFKFDELVASDAQLLGRRTYEGFAKAWPLRDEDEFSQRMNSMPKYVVSSTITVPSWNNTTVLSGDLAGEVTKLKERYAGDILVAGSAQLVQGLLALGLVDELRLMVFPILLGTGKRLFVDGAELRFSLAETAQSADVTMLTLRAEPS